MDRDAELRQMVEREIKRYQGLLLYKERQQLKRGEFEAIARTLIRRMKRCYWGVGIAVPMIAMGILRPYYGEWGRLLPRAALACGYFAWLTYMAHGWGRLSGSMTAVLAMLGREDEAEDQVDAT